MEVIEATPSLARVRLFETTPEIALFQRSRAKNGGWNPPRKAILEYPYHNERPPKPSKYVMVEARKLAIVSMIQADVESGPFPREKLESIANYTVLYEKNDNRKLDDAAEHVILEYHMEDVPAGRTLGDAIRQVTTLINWRRSRFATWLPSPHHPRPAWIAGEKPKRVQPEQPASDPVGEWWEKIKNSSAVRRDMRAISERDAWLTDT